MRARAGRPIGHLAAQFKGNPNVIGFELINEPFAGDFYRDPLLMYPGVADKKNLQPFYGMLSSRWKGQEDFRLCLARDLWFGDVV